MYKFSLFIFFNIFFVNIFGMTFEELKKEQFERDVKIKDLKRKLASNVITFEELKELQKLSPVKGSMNYEEKEKVVIANLYLPESDLSKVTWQEFKRKQNHKYN